jgi:hypothetical protein
MCKLLRSTCLVLSLMMMPTLAMGQNPTSIPDHTQQCTKQITMAQGFWLYRVAGLTLDEGTNAVRYSVRIVQYLSKDDDTKTAKKLADTLSVLTAIYEIPEDKITSGVYQREWINLKLAECVEANEPEAPAPKDNRMLPPKKGERAARL